MAEENNKEKGTNIVKTYVITIEHNRKLELLKPILGRNKSELVRLGIDTLFEKYLPQSR